MNIKRAISLILIFALLIPLIPLGEIRAFAAEEKGVYDPEKYKIDEVILYKIYDRNRNLEKRILEVHGAYLKNASVTIRTSQGSIELKNPKINNDSLLQFELGEEKPVDKIDVGNTKDIQIDEGTMPTLSDVSRKVENEKGTLMLKGSKLENIADTSNSINAYYEHQTGGKTQIDSYYFNNISDGAVFIEFLSGQLGIQNIIFEKQTEENKHFNEKHPNVKLKTSITYTYKDQFSFYSPINVNNLEMRPNRGVPGEKVFFEAPIGNEASNLQEYDVFFLKATDGTDEYKVENKGKNRKFQPKVTKDDNDYSVLTVEVPNIPIGEYYVILTNVTDGKDPMKAVTQEMVLEQKFTIINGTIKAKILDVDPSKGPDTGSKTTISGQFFGTLNIPEFKPKNKELIVEKPKEEDAKKLTVNYGEGTYGDGENPIEISEAKRQIKVIIGGEATFLTKDGDDGEEFDVIFTDDLDEIEVRTSKVTDGDTNPVKDVVVETETVLTKKDGGTIVIRERAEKKNGYTYLISKIKPEIRTIVPERIQVVESGTKYKIPENRMVAIHGKNFMIHKYRDDSGNEIVRYPKIQIGEITIDKNQDKEDKYYVKVLDEKGNVLDGTEGKELGSKILIILPSETEITNLGKADVIVQNPIRNSENYGLSHRKENLVEFVCPTEGENPVITNVKPDTVPVDGGEQVVIEGSNFQEGVKVFIDGEEVKTIKRREDGKEIKFNAPKGREGKTQLQVMNFQGGMDTREFFYVRTFTNPKIIDFAPKRGNTGTIVIVKGENFMKPDPIATDESIYRLIGTRVQLGEVELNEYNRDPITKGIKVEPFSPKKALFYKEDDNVKAEDYYNGVLLKDESGKYYTVDVKPNGEIILSDGGLNNYKIELDDNKNIVANKQGGDIHKLGVTTSSITIYKPNSNEKLVELKYASLYKTEDGQIVGNKVKVIDRDTIYFEVPILGAPGFYDLTVINPDTKKDSKTGKAGFEYVTQPDLKPRIKEIIPNEGSVEGGYSIDIIGEDFEADSSNKPKVYINGIEVPVKDTNVSIDGKKITVVVPKYQGDLREEKGTDRWPVPVVVLNPDGSTASNEKGFYYVVPASNPKISKLVPTKGTAAGGDIVEIIGFDFRYFEPYDDKDRNQMLSEGEKWNDLYKNNTWDDLLDIIKEDKDSPVLGKTPIDHPLFDAYYASPILPRVYFGGKQAKIVEFSRGYIKVITPPNQAGKVDVFLTNNDGGISNKVPFNYEATTVKIDSLIPNEGRKQGGDRIEVHGSGFATTEMDIYTGEYIDGKSDFNTKNMPLIKFGDISNRNIDREKTNGGRIDNNRSTVELAGGLKAEFNGVDEKIVLTIKEGKKIYKTEVLGYDNTVKYIPVNLLKEGSNQYDGKELIRVEVSDKKFIVERGYSTDANYLNSTQMTVETPSYHTVGNVPVFVINPDGGTGEGKFEYKNPDSNPVITTITKEGRGPIEEYREEINGNAKVQKVNNKGGNIISIEGTDFREGAVIKISNILTITEKDIDYNLPNKLTFIMPPVPESEVGKLNRVVVQNKDGGTATSDKNIPPIFIEFTKGESDPQVLTVEPISGPATGGTKVKITGEDFREKMEGFEGEKLSVYFGESKVEDKNIKYIDYKTIEVAVPASEELGPVPVRIENPDGSVSDGKVNFTYISKPSIETVSPNKLFTNDTKTEVTITGKMFLPGAIVIVGGKIVDKKDLTKDMKVLGEGIIGVDAQGKNREVAVVGGIEAASVKVESDKLLKVIFKEGKDLENNNLIIINSDGGISDPYDKFQYQIPIPSKPLVLEGIPGYESTVKLLWSESDEDILNRATRYEVYGKLASDKEYTFIGDTSEAEYLVKGLKVNTEYIFMVRALNEHGAAIDFATVKVRTLNAREDEKLKEKEEKLKKEEQKLLREGKEEIIEGRVIKTIGTDNLIGGVGTVDFSLAKYKNNNKFTVQIPMEMVRKDSRITIKDGTFSFIFNPRDLYTLEVSKKDRGNSDAYIRIHFEREKESYIPRSKKASSKAYNISFDYIYGKEMLEIKRMVKSGKLFLKHDTITYPNRKDIYLARFNEAQGKYLFVTKDSSTNMVDSGRFILLSDK
ncbi:IPT/TIG domain-containing protein [Anaerosalibacter sp. Marseille-P3206]|uniref:IPT/TIG domain-containing protein n=1 Tax=Anaerosalibacter sp. Marseille-P3206 TaxID=1871005 RepID=UPI000984EACA|nr:IPT/TIG domain-containing protein [Anaerosalibacter sp. Marseille-P3206]